MDISQGRVAIRLGYGGVFKYDFITNFLLSLTVKEIRKSVNIWRSYGPEYSVFFDSQCILYNCCAVLNKISADAERRAVPP